MASGSRVRRGGDADGQLWMRRVTARVSAAMAEGDDQIRRLRSRGYQAAALDPDVVARHNRRYSLRLPFGRIENQDQTGNCWLFAPTVLVRAAALRGGHISSRESFSETYLYFHNLLNRASASLDRVGRLTAREDAVGRDALRRGLSDEVMGLSDGGEWEWAFNLIDCYGLVPASRMPPT